MEQSLHALDTAQKSIIIKVKNDKFEYIKIKILCLSKDTIKTVKNKS